MKAENYRKEKKNEKRIGSWNSKSKVLKAMKVTLAERGQIFIRFNAKMISVV